MRSSQPNQPMGPLALADLIGLDTCLSIMEVLHKGLGDSKYRQKFSRFDGLHRTGPRPCRPGRQWPPCVPTFLPPTSTGAAGVDPAIMGIGPVYASRKALAKAGLTTDILGQDIIHLSPPPSPQNVLLQFSHQVALESESCEPWPTFFKEGGNTFASVLRGSDPRQGLSFILKLSLKSLT